MLLILLLLVLNFSISWLNAWSVGFSWLESESVGGWPKFMNWCAAIMSASGFTWVYITILAILAGSIGKLPDQYVKATLELGYIIVIFPIIGSGLAITIDSWAIAWRRKSFGSTAIAGWNTFAQIYNTANAIKTLPSAMDDVLSVFSGKGSKDKNGAVIVILLVIIGLIGGILTTTAIVRSTMKKHALSYGTKNGIIKKPRWN